MASRLPLSRALISAILPRAEGKEVCVGGRSGCVQAGTSIVCLMQVCSLSCCLPPHSQLIGSAVCKSQAQAQREGKAHTPTTPNPTHILTSHSLYASSALLLAPATPGLWRSTSAEHLLLAADAVPGAAAWESSGLLLLWAEERPIPAMLSRCRTSSTLSLPS